METIEFIITHDSTVLRNFPIKSLEKHGIKVERLKGTSKGVNFIETYKLTLEKESASDSLMVAYSIGALVGQLTKI